MFSTCIHEVIIALHIFDDLELISLGWHALPAIPSLHCTEVGVEGTASQRPHDSKTAKQNLQPSVPSESLSNPERPDNDGSYEPKVKHGQRHNIAAGKAAC